MTSTSYIHPHLNQEKNKTELAKEIVFDFFRFPGYVSSRLAALGEDTIQSICSQKEIHLREKLANFFDDFLPSYKEEREIKSMWAYFNYSSPKSETNLYSGIHIDPALYNVEPRREPMSADPYLFKVETLVNFANKNVEKYESFSSLAKKQIREIVVEAGEKLKDTGNAEWNPNANTDIIHALTKCNRVVGGLDSLIQDFDPLRQAVKNCHVRIEDDWGRPSYVRSSETVPVMLHRLSQVVLNHLPRNDIQSDESNAMYTKLKGYGARILDHATYLERNEYAQQIKEDPTQSFSKEQEALFEEHCNQQLMPLKETVDRLLQSAQMALTSDIGQTLDIKETNEKPMVSTSPSL